MNDIIRSLITQQVYKLMLNLSTIRDAVFPSAEYMARKLNCSVRSIWYAIKRLFKYGFIFYFGKADGKSGIWSWVKRCFHISNNYLIHLRLKEFWLWAGRYFQREPARFLKLMTLHKQIVEENPEISEEDYCALMNHHFGVSKKSFKQKTHKSFLFNSLKPHCTLSQITERVEDFPSLPHSPPKKVKNVHFMKKRFYESHLPDVIRGYYWTEANKNAVAYAMYCLKKHLSVPDTLKIFMLSWEDYITWSDKYGKANNALAFLLSRIKDNAKKLFGLENYIILKKAKTFVKVC